MATSGRGYTGGRCTTAPSVQPPSPSAPAQDTPPEQHSISPFFQLSHMVEASQSGGGSSQAAADAAAVAAASRAAVWRTYEVCGTQSVAQPLRTWAEATTPASRSSALDAAFGFWCTPAGSSASLSARRPADTPPNHSRPASFGSAARRSDPLTPRYRRTAAVHRSPVPQAPPASRVVAASNDACAESWPDLWLDAVIEGLLEEEALQPAVLTGRRPEFGSTAGNTAAAPRTAPTAPQFSPSAKLVDIPFTWRSHSRRLQTIVEEPEGSLKPSKPTGVQQLGSAADTAALAGPQQRPHLQQAWTRRFSDSRLEQRFRLYQARVLQPVDFVAAILALLICFTTGFSPVPAFRAAPLTWPLVLVTPALLIFLSSWAPVQWYRRHREAILMCAMFLLLVMPRMIVGPFWLAVMDSQRLRSVSNILRVSGAQASIGLQVGLRIRLSSLLPFSLLLACFSLVPLRMLATKYEAEGVASWSCVVFWGALWHLTAGILLPTLAASFMERRERRHFLQEEAAGAKQL